MSLEKAEVIDFVSLSADGQTITLHLVATDPWPASGEGALLLQAKLKNYVAYAADGQLTREYPEACGKKVTIEIRSESPTRSDRGETRGGCSRTLVRAGRHQPGSFAWISSMTPHNTRLERTRHKRASLLSCVSEPLKPSVRYE